MILLVCLLVYAVTSGACLQVDISIVGGYVKFIVCDCRPMCEQVYVGVWGSLEYWVTVDCQPMMASFRPSPAQISAVLRKGIH